jgi:UDP-GlcNAc:undecaprenyl-phosphate GlcNAc-1-phosphate transferase
MLLSHFSVLGTSALVAFLVGGLVRRVAIRLGIVVPPRPDRWHRFPTPTFGGIGVAIGIAAGVSVGPAFGLASWSVLGVAAALFVIGWYDDVAPMSALAKMVSSLAAAAFFVFTVSTLGASPVHAALTVAAIVWFGGLVNAINLLDNMDGLAAGVAALSAMGLAITFHRELGPELVAVLVALAGALAGFLIWNRHPARLFMGNCGSLAIGGIIAAASTYAVARAGTATAAVAAGLILVVPIFDSGFVLLLRRLAGRSTTAGNIDHTSHRLVSAGFSERTAIAMLYALGIAGAAIGYLLYVHGAVVSPIAAVFAVGVLMVGLYLARVPAYAGQDFRALQNAPFAPLLADLTFRWHAGEVLLDLVLITTCYYGAYRIRFEGEADLPVFLGTFALSLPVIVGCKLAALYVSGLYSRMWSTFGLHDLSTVIRGVAGGSILAVLAVTYLYKFDERFSRSVFVIDAVLLLAAIIATRISFRMIGRVAARSSPQKRRVAIYGAGRRGQLLVREMHASDQWELRPILFVDDNAGTHARRILGVPVSGGLETLDKLIQSARIEEVLLSSPDIGDAAEQRVRDICGARGIPVRRLHLEIR